MARRLVTFVPPWRHPSPANDDAADPLSDEDLLARLVAFDTTSHKSNREMADFISDYLDRPGVRITRHPTADCFVWLA